MTHQGCGRRCMLSSDRMGLPTLETERLILRPWSLDDIDALHQIWTDPQVRRYLWDDEVIPLSLIHI